MALLISSYALTSIKTLAQCAMHGNLNVNISTKGINTRVMTQSLGGGVFGKA